jgi:GDP-4-dehydro-6-deoxy-D-mannose reductase
MLRICVTGADGFVGRHFARLAAECGHEVVGVVRSSSDPAPVGLTEVVECDLTERWPALPEVDVVLHLAGLADVGASFAEPRRYIDANAAMVINMCEALLRGGAPTRVVGVSSGAVYGASAHPVSEESGVAFSSPYVVSKIAVENLLAYYNGRGLDCVVARPFNHIGPGQGPGFLVPDLTARMSQLGEEEPLETGDLSTRRDYTDVRDVVAAYLLMCEAPSLEHRVYNIASGTSISGEDVLQEVCRALGRRVPARTEIAPGLRRPIDNPVVTGDASRLGDELGWRPRVSFSESIRAFVAASQS